MNKYNEGDRIRATLGSAELTGDVTFEFLAGAATIKDSGMFIRSLEASGWTVVITDPAPPKWAMPTEYGYYLDTEGDIWELSNLWFKRLFDLEDSVEDYGPFVPLAPVPATAKVLLDRFESLILGGARPLQAVDFLRKEFGVSE